MFYEKKLALKGIKYGHFWQKRGFFKNLNLKTKMCSVHVIFQISNKFVSMLCNMKSD
jgi:hypothetical protein